MKCLLLTWDVPQHGSNHRGSHFTKESLHKTLSTVALNQLKAGASIGNATFHLSRCSECFPSTLPGRKGALVRGSSVSGYRVKGKRGRRRYPGQTCDTKKDLGSQKREFPSFSQSVTCLLLGCSGLDSIWSMLHGLSASAQYLRLSLNTFLPGPLLCSYDEER